MIMPAMPRPVAQWKAVEKFIAAVQRLTKPQQIALTTQPNAKLLSNFAAATIATDEIGAPRTLCCTCGCANCRGDTGFVLCKLDKFASVEHIYARQTFQLRFQKWLQCIL